MKEIIENKNVKINIYDDIESATEKGREPFIVTDVASVMHASKMFQKHKLYYIERYGTNPRDMIELKDKYINQIIGDNVIIIRSSISADEFPETEYTDSKNDESGRKLLPVKDILNYYRAILGAFGFKTINDFVGYEFHEAFIYTGNKAGLNLFDQISKITSMVQNNRKDSDESNNHQE